MMERKPMVTWFCVRCNCGMNDQCAKHPTGDGPVCTSCAIRRTRPLT